VNSILFIQTAFLGDVILATASIEQAKMLFPQAKIDILVKKGNESLLDKHPHIRNVYTFDKKKGKIIEIIRLIRIFRANKYEITFNFHRFGSSGILTSLSGAKKKYGFRKNPFSFLFTKRFEHKIDGKSHEIDRNFQMFAEFNPSTRKLPKLYPTKQSWLKTRKLKIVPYYCIAPASVWATKQLPVNKWVELIKQLNKDSNVYLIGSPSDEALCKDIIKQINQPNVINLAGKMNLLDTATLMHDAIRNFVNDSAPLHIASAMNAPVTAFFCSTVPKFGFGPLSDDKQILGVDNLPCRPCGLHGHKKCPRQDFLCGEIQFSFSDILQKK